MGAGKGIWREYVVKSVQVYVQDRYLFRFMVKLNAGCQRHLREGVS